jgi:hypothetical protein
LVVAVTIVVAIMLRRMLRVLLNYLRAGQIARLRKSVRAPEGLPALVAEIDRQLAGRDPKARRMGPILLPSWLVYVTPFSFSLTSASDVIWVAPYIVTGKLYGVIPVSRRHQLHIVSRNGRKLSLPILETRIPEALAAYRRWAPWAVIGPDKTMEEYFGRSGSWHTGPRAKAEVIAMIDKRREEILAMRAAQSGPVIGASR